MKSYNFSILLMIIVLLTTSCSFDLEDCDNKDCSIIVHIESINTIDGSPFEHADIHFLDENCSLIGLKYCEFEEIKNENPEPGFHEFEYKSPCGFKFQYGIENPFRRYFLKLDDLNFNAVDSICNSSLRVNPGNEYNYKIEITPAIQFKPRKSTNLPDSLISIQIDEFDINTTDISEIGKMLPIPAMEFDIHITKEYLTGEIIRDTLPFDYNVGYWDFKFYY